MKLQETASCINTLRGAIICDTDFERVMLFRWIILLNFFGLVSFSLGQPLQGFREIQTAINALETASGNYSTIVSLLQNSTYSSALNLTDGSNKTILAPSDSVSAPHLICG